MPPVVIQREMFVPVADAVARLGDALISEEDQEVILVNRFYLRGVGQVDPVSGESMELPEPTRAAGE